MYEKILVPLDGSQLAELALRPALSIARRAGGEITLLSVPVHRHVDLTGTAGYGLPVHEQSVDRRLEREEEYLAGVRADNDEARVNISIKVIEGDVAGIIVDTATVQGVDLIVMTTHGYSGFTRWMLGSVAERVLRGAPCPVLVLRRAENLKKAMITLDGSRLAEQALRPGLEIAQLLGCETTLLRVDQQDKLSSVEMGFLEVASSELCQEIAQDDADRVTYYLDCVAEKLKTQKHPIQTAVVKGKPAECILEFIEGQQIDLVSIATHGYSGLKRWAYGSVTEKILRKADCAMLVIRPPKEVLH
ncbi:MAG: universal stress protein [Candidatus Promineifilaceae bacterium]